MLSYFISFHCELSINLISFQECIRQNFPVTPENKRAVLGEVFGLIRFPTMGAEEFGEVGEVLTIFILYLAGKIAHFFIFVLSFFHLMLTGF